MSTHSSNIQSQMSKEDQINLISYAKFFTSLKVLFKIQPLDSLRLICLNSLNRLVPYLGSQELTIQGRGVLSQPRIIALLNWCCGNANLNPSHGQLGI
ncbi:hypothetical protein O181_092141 [Austropuccinia psidii MF-1]|uniref:Uncharacterized protein n=1 Tax=Austropuccinia psidii MF-1 TaxID=1389203 RepID=A0A9Q3PAB3_9BASI|nr:hypothetical protein [Austropuccinia psidii MF-1]